MGGNYTQLFLTPILFDLLHTQYIVCFVGYCFFLQPVVLSKKTKKTSLAKKMVWSSKVVCLNIGSLFVRCGDNRVCSVCDYASQKLCLAFVTLLQIR